jgi:hypothetical protein
MGRNLGSFLKNHYISLSLVTLIVLGTLLVKHYGEKSLNDGIIYATDNNYYHISGVSKKEAEILDSTMNRLHESLVAKGDLSSNFCAGYYTLNVNSGTARTETSAQFLHEVVDSSGLTKKYKKGL